jgi:Flp pilus assembly protein TadG
MMLSFANRDEKRRCRTALPPSGPGPDRSKRRRRRGTVLVLTVLLMVTFIGMLAFAVDVGYIVHVRTDLQRTADACAVAAAECIPDLSEAKAVARAVALENGWSSGLSDGDAWNGRDDDPMTVAFGFWHRDAATFTSPPPFGRQANSVKVTLRRTEATRNPLRLFFARVLGETEADVQASAIAMYDRWLCGPFVGIDWLSVPGTPDTDSYDSDEGFYDPARARHRGSVCSDGPINVDGNPVIKGDARAGKGYGVSITGGGTVTGSVGSRLKPLNMPPVDASEAAVINNNDRIPLIPQGNSWTSPVDADGNFLLDGNKVIDMPPGTYYFNNFTLTGQSVFNISGPTTIYVTGNFERSGGTVVNNNSRVPGNLEILMTGGTALVTSENAFYGVIYAPNTDVTIDGSADLFGAVVGKTLTLTGTGQGHYDESLDLEEIEFPRRVALVD